MALMILPEFLETVVLWKSMILPEFLETVIMDMNDFA